MNNKIELFDIADELIIMPKAVIDEFLKHKKPGDLIALYSFYYYTAKWQKTNQPKATTNYTAKGLSWTEAKVRMNKKILIDIGLVKDIKDRDKQSNKIKGWYIKVNYIFKRETENNIKATLTENHKGGISNSVENKETNALSSNNLNALSSNNNNDDKKSSVSNTVYKEIENKYYSLFINLFNNQPDYRYGRDRKLITPFIVQYGKDFVMRALDIYFDTKMGDFYGYSIKGLSSSWNKILTKIPKKKKEVKMQKLEHRWVERINGN